MRRSDDELLGSLLVAWFVYAAVKRHLVNQAAKRAAGKLRALVDALPVP